MGFKRLGEIVVHYQRSERRGAPTLVFANSLGTDLRVWDPLLPHLGDRFAVVRYDKRGHGLTDATPGPYRMAELAQDLARLLEFLAVKDAIVCGLSIGGMIAQELAASRPDLVRALVLMDTGAKIGTAEMWQQRIEAVEGPGIASIADGILQRWFAPTFHEQRPDELAGWRNMLTRTPVAGYAGCCAAIRDADLVEGARRIAVPTLCLVGDNDGATPPAVVRELSQLIPNAGFAEIAAAGHLPCVERPQAVARQLQRFFEENRLG
jgi:3-oxoadipate enol-lactonase